MSRSEVCGILQCHFASWSSYRLPRAPPRAPQLRNYAKDDGRLVAGTLDDSDDDDNDDDRDGHPDDDPHLYIETSAQSYTE